MALQDELTNAYLGHIGGQRGRTIAAFEALEANLPTGGEIETQPAIEDMVYTGTNTFFQATRDKLNEILAALRAAGIIET